MSCDGWSQNNRLREAAPGQCPEADASDLALVVRDWREAASLLEAACAVVARFESPETVAIQDAANCRASEAFAALAAVRDVHPVALRGHAEALEWLMHNFGALSDGPHEAALGQSIAFELRAAAALLEEAGPARPAAPRSAPPRSAPPRSAPPRSATGRGRDGAAPEPSPGFPAPCPGRRS